MIDNKLIMNSFSSDISSSSSVSSPNVLMFDTIENTNKSCLYRLNNTNCSQAVLSIASNNTSPWPGSSTNWDLLTNPLYKYNFGSPTTENNLHWAITDDHNKWVINLATGKFTVYIG